MERTLTVTAKARGKVRDVLKNAFSYTTQKNLKKEYGRILKNGLPVKANELCCVGDEITVRIPETGKPYEIVKDVGLRSLYEDEDIAVVYKPKGVCSMATFGHVEDCLFAGLNALYGKGVYRIVTRLDKDTDGLVLVAKNPLAHSVLNDSLVEKEYTALLRGTGLKSSFTVDLPISRGEGIVRVIGVGGQPSITEFSVIKETEGNTLVKARPITGRTHQIRVHAKACGHPVVGDTLYGDGVGAYNSGQKLTCTFLRFSHPVNGEILTFQTDFTF